MQFFKDRVRNLNPSDHLGAGGSKPMTSICGGTVLLESGLLIEYDWYSLYYLAIHSYQHNLKDRRWENYIALMLSRKGPEQE